MTEDKIQKKINDIALHIAKEHLKEKVPLFVIGVGVSTDLKIPRKLKDRVKKMSVPNMMKIIKKLHSLYEGIEKTKISSEVKEEIDKHFNSWTEHIGKKLIVDRSIVSGILGYFQENECLKEVWIEFNEWLLNKCVNETENFGITNAYSSEAHDKIAELYEKVDAFCLTTNFDGLFYKALKSKYGNDAQSCCTKEKVEGFLTRTKLTKEREYAEIQVRGDIFFVECDKKWCKRDYKACTIRSSEPIRIFEWQSNHLQCKRGEYMKPFISFPGSYEKDKEIRDIISILWRYFAYKVSCVITIGSGGWWDPILVAFLSDLARERKIPFIDVNSSPQNSFIAKEIVEPQNSLPLRANDFMDKLNKSIDCAVKENQNRTQYKLVCDRRNANNRDEFWDQYNDILGWKGLTDFEKKLLENDLVKITQNFAQLGLKSKWWGIDEEVRRLHNRLNHSKGVMKVANFLYEKACENSKRKIREEEQQFLRIAALLHDIGHLPFSHLIEEVFQELNWKPSGYIESFTHDYYTKEKVEEIFNTEELKEELENIGYTVDDLARLINGEFGVGFLDAIINGPVDADKIDYVFRDAALAKVFPHLIESERFLEHIGKNISLSPEGLLILRRTSFTVLDQRERLYKEFYLSSHIRLLEKAVKFIIVTYFVHKYNTLENIPEKFLNDKSQLSDLGPIRISMAVQELEELSRKYRDRDIEMSIVAHMKDTLIAQPIDKRIKRAIKECFSFIDGINEATECRDENSKRELKLSVSQFSRERIEKVRYDAKTVILRFPGAILIDVLSPFEFFIISKTRRQKFRSDGTNVQSECILSSDLIQQVNNHQRGRKEEGKVFVYKIGEESEVKRAMDLFEKLLGEEKKLEEVE